MIQVRKTNHCWMRILIRTCRRRRIMATWFRFGFDQASLAKIPDEKLEIV